MAALARSVTAAIAHRAREYRFDELPPDVVQVAKHCLLDWVGVAIAGSTEQVSALVRAEVLEEGGAPRATLLGTGERVSLRGRAGQWHGIPRARLRRRQWRDERPSLRRGVPGTPGPRRGARS